jgi:hypothetical protein
MIPRKILPSSPGLNSKRVMVPKMSYKVDKRMELYSSPSIIRLIKMTGGTCSTHERREMHAGFEMGEPEGRKPLGRPTEDNVKMDVREIGTAMNRLLSLNVGIFLSS